MKNLFLITAILISTQMASAYVYTCTCTVQRNNGELQTATTTVQASNEEQAKQISNMPCYQAAVRKFQFLTNFSNPTLVSNRCGSGAIYSIH